MRQLSYWIGHKNVLVVTPPAFERFSSGAAVMFIQFRLKRQTQEMILQLVIIHLQFGCLSMEVLISIKFKLKRER